MPGMPGAAPGPGSGSGRALRLAHRGDWRRAPENTLEALVAALEVPGCDGVELDVRVSPDGIPVLLHDDTLARVQRRPHRVDELGAAELAEHGIPTLAEVLRVLPRTAFLDVELKGGAHGEPTAAVLRAGRGDAPWNAVVSSFEVPALVAMGRHLPNWRRWLNAMDITGPTVRTAIDLGCTGVSVDWRTITPATIASARGAGLDVAAWTVRRRATFERLSRLGVMAVCVEAAALDGARP